jgi:hypothetical protein
LKQRIKKEKLSGNNNNSSSHHHQTIAHHHMQDISGLPLLSSSLNTTTSL